MEAPKASRRAARGRAAGAASGYAFPAFQRLPPELLRRIAAELPPNDRALRVRLVSRAAAAALGSGPQHATVHLSQPVPSAEFAWRWTGPDALRTLYPYHMDELPLLTARSGSVRNLKLLRARGDLMSTSSWDSLLRAAAAGGQLNVCRWLQQQGCAVDGDRGGYTLSTAAAAGHEHVCEWLIEHGAYDSMALVGAAASAARSGHPSLMRKLLQHRDRLPTDIQHAEFGRVVVGAAEGCDLATLQRLHRRAAQRAQQQPAANAATGSNQSVLAACCASRKRDWRDKVAWAEGLEGARKSASCTKAAVAVAAPDALARLQWLCGARGYPVEISAIVAAIEYGKTDVMLYLLPQLGAQLQQPDAQAQLHAAFENAARAGHLHLLRAARAGGMLAAYGMDGAGGHAGGGGGDGAQQQQQQQGPLAGVEGAAGGAAGAGGGEQDDEGGGAQQPLRGLTELLSAALAGRELEVATWLVEEAAGPHILTRSVVRGAAHAANLEVLKWLHARGWPSLIVLDATTFFAAVERGSEEAVEWLAARGCERGDNGYAYVAAAVARRLPMLRRLRALGVPWRRDTFGFAVRKCMDRAEIAPMPFRRSFERWKPALRLLLDLGCPARGESVQRVFS